MSAIAGIYNLNKEPVSEEHIRKIMDVFLKYPVDEIGTLKKDNIFLGCHAQWITPESVGEILPFYDYERQLLITADAIIDNRKELLSKLNIDSQKGKYITDSQLILLAYSKWGEDVPKHLIGDFSFILWDEKKRKLFAARDFSGARTLYYYQDQERVVFSTTMESLLTLPYVHKELNEQWLAEFITIPSMVDAVDTISTVYKHIKQIPPSHFLTILNGKVTLTRYCRISAVEKLILKSDIEYEEAFQDIFERAVIDRLRTHGNVGAQLSGGLDSGSVVSFAARALQKENKTLNTFSFIPVKHFKDWTSKYYIPDERPFIKETVRHVGNISDNYLDFDGQNPLTIMDEFIQLMEMPYKFFENSYWLKGINQSAQKNGIKILLNGARGNFSISWGSIEINLNYYSSLLRKMKLIELYKELDLYCSNFNTGKSVIIPAIIKGMFSLNLQSIKKVNKDTLNTKSIINPSLAKRTNVYEKLESIGMYSVGKSRKSPFEIRNKHFEELHYWNKNGVATTKLSLRYALWDRDPTNDIRVIRFCLSIPQEQYARGGFDRSLIRRATKDFLPNKVRLNNKSRGLQSADVVHRLTPSWSMLISEMKQLSNDIRIAEFFDKEEITRVINKFSSGPRQEFIFDNDFRKLFSCLVIYRFIKHF
ncbi:asparagine synthase-related protein [Bacillus sp. JJ1566]|uniref:asparagine synthase-related protein n=1 Tax=Bacillus sp. JJ1566 TaxID=3122961 RepID=UPI002FFF5BF0